jgi:hypothetical protein
MQPYSTTMTPQPYISIFTNITTRSGMTTCCSDAVSMPHVWSANSQPDSLLAPSTFRDTNCRHHSKPFFSTIHHQPRTAKMSRSQNIPMSNFSMDDEGGYIPSPGPRRDH